MKIRAFLSGSVAKKLSVMVNNKIVCILVFWYSTVIVCLTMKPLWVSSMVLDSLLFSN